jgi:uridine phosphorylase
MAREPTASPGHLRPHAPVAERVLLPGDPGRALRLAQDLTTGPKMVNHHRGLWGYSGPAADGAPLTLQATGLGGPSAAAVTDEVIGLGGRRLVRVGTCTALDPALAPGDLLVVDAVLAADGTSRALGGGDVLQPDPGLRAALGEDLEPVTAVSLDYGADPHAHPRARVRDMTTAAVLAAAARRDVPAAAVLLVVEDARGDRLGDEALHAAELELGRAAARALADGAATASAA